MIITKEEYMKILDYILENYDSLMDNCLFSSDFLLQIRNYVKGKRVDDSFMLDGHKEFLIKHFLKYGSSFNEDTPNIITSNILCIDKALNSDINSINYIYDIFNKMPRFKDYIIKSALDNNYILSSKSPLMFRSNFSICLNSIKIDCFSSNYVDFISLNDEEIILLINELLSSNYILNGNSSKFLRSNEKVIIHSIMIDPNSYHDSDISLHENYNIFNALVKAKYSFILDDLLAVPLSYLKDLKSLSYCFECLQMYPNANQLFKERFSKLYFDSLRSFPTIKSFDEVFDYLCENCWLYYKHNNVNILSNVFSKICSMIQSNDSYHDFLIEFKELGNNMEIILKGRFELLMDSIYKYYELYHNSSRDKSGIEMYKTIISRLSSLYIADSKEVYKKKIRCQFYDVIKKYFKPRLDNKIINKRLLQFIRKSIFRSRYIENDPELINFINDLTDRYVNDYGEWIKLVINTYLKRGYTDLYYILKKPDNYFVYLKYKNAVKLVNRLNSGYINFKDNELNNYRDVIVYDHSFKCYKCIINIDSFNYDECLSYERKELIFKKFIKDVMIFINNIKVDNNMISIYNNYIDGIIKDLKFNDDFYEFNFDFLSKYNFSNLVINCTDSFKSFNLSTLINDNNYKTIYDFLVNKNVLWFLLLKSDLTFDLLDNSGISFYNIIDIFNNIDKIIYLSNSMKIKIDNISNLFLLEKLISCCDERNINLLGFDIINMLCSNISYASFYTACDIVSVASDLVCQMSKKEKSSVPYVSGYYSDYNYSMYDSFSKEVLLTGIFTDSCLRTCGNDNDLFHYCLIDKNGFIIRIANSNGDFIGRAAGFRNGNFVFINQLRTIYDVGGIGYKGKFASEQNEIIDVLKHACQEMISISKNNSLEKVKIDYVFITRSYSLEEYSVNRNLSKMVYSSIGDVPVCLDSDDWINFVNETKNLIESRFDKCFDCDYLEYDLICLASSRQLGFFGKKNIIIGDVPAVYNRPRKKLIFNSNITDDIYKRINEVRSIYSYYHSDVSFLELDSLNNSLYIVGDNWYIIYSDRIIDYCVLDNNELSMLEFNDVCKLLNDNTREDLVTKIKRLTI